MTITITKRPFSRESDGVIFYDSNTLEKGASPTRLDDKDKETLSLFRQAEFPNSTLVVSRTHAFIIPESPNPQHPYS